MANELNAVERDTSKGKGHCTSRTQGVPRDVIIGEQFFEFGDKPGPRWNVAIRFEPQFREGAKKWSWEAR